MRHLFFILALFLSGAAFADEPKLGAFSANYSVAWSGTGLGDAVVSLEAEPEKDCYRYRNQTNPVSMVRWLYGSPVETSVFCMKDGVIRPRHFEYRIDKRAKDNFTLDFDWSARTLKAQKRGVVTERELPETAYDRLVLQQAVRRWVQSQPGDGATCEFNMADDDRIAVYKFAIIGAEAMETPAGKFDTLRVERVDNPNKSMRFWLAPSRDYTPVRIERIEDGKIKLLMLLK